MKGPDWNEGRSRAAPDALEQAAGTTIDYFSLGHPLSRVRSHFALRARRMMFDRFMAVMRPDAHTRVLDLGVTPERSLPESNLFEALYPYKKRLTAASIEDASFLVRAHPGLTFVRIGTGALPFADDAFDLLFCSAVLEHVGCREHQRRFVGECLRVSRRFFLATPNRQFPLDFHTLLPVLHWLPQSWHQAALRALGLDFWARTENLNLLTPRELRALLPPCRRHAIYCHRLMGLPSNIVVYGEK